RRLFELRELRAHEWNPLIHNPGRLFYGLLVRDGTGALSAAQRLEALIARLEALPDALATAKAVLTDPPRIHLETAVGQFAGVAALIRSEIPALAERVPDRAARAKTAQDKALAALDEFGNWLSRRLSAQGEGRSPRLGRALWEARLAHTLDSELSATELLDRAWANLERVTEQIRKVAADLTGGR